MQRSNRVHRRYTRRAAAVAQVALCSTIIVGMAALVIDIGAAYTTQTEVQVAADAAALAAAAELAGHPEGDIHDLAVAAADDYASQNLVRGCQPKVTSEDVELGRAVFDPQSGKYTFEAGGDTYDSVRVTVQRRVVDGEPDNWVPLQVPFLFGSLLTQGTTTLRARGTAVLVPRDIAVVIDVSNSMCWDSQLRFWDRTDGGYSNIRDVWCALDGPQPSHPYVPASADNVDETEYLGDTGPSIGWMTTWGTALDPASYSASSDPGLWYIKKGTTTNVAAINTLLTNTGYTSAERSAIKSGSNDSNTTHWKNRCAVMLGLANWKSGKSGARFPGGGDGDNYVENNEMVWAAYPSWRVNWTWTEFVDHVQGGTTDSVFRYRYGLKTFMDFLLEQSPQYNETNNLWATPEQPLRSVKDAVQTLSEVIDELDSLDQLSLEIFATSARHEVNLSDDLYAPPTRLYLRQSGHYDRATNMGGGLQKAIAELTSARARGYSAKVIILMSDGVPNIDQWGNWVPDGDPAAENWALSQAQDAANRGFRIYTVSVGVSADRALMQQIAAIGHGEEFYAAGSPDEYAVQLEEIFRTLGGKRPVVLID